MLKIAVEKTVLLYRLIFQNKGGSGEANSKFDDEVQMSSEAMSRADKIIRDIGNSIYDEAFSLARKEGRSAVEVADVDAAAKAIASDFWTHPAPKYPITEGDTLSNIRTGNGREMPSGPPPSLSKKP